MRGLGFPDLQYVSKYQVMGDVSLVSSAELEDSRACASGNDDSATTEEAASCQEAS